MNKKKRNLIIATIVAIILLIIAIVFVVNSKDDSANVSTNDVVVDEDNANVSTDESEVLEDDANVSKDDSNDLSSNLEDLETSTSDEDVLSDSDLSPTPEPHEHTYIESVVSEATCTNLGTKKFTCECGDTYEEHIDMLSHELGEFIYNNDATYEKDGTESASCKVCANVIETRTKEGTMLVKEPEPVSPTPSGLDTTIGDGYTFSGTTTSHNGVTLKTLNKFNSAGLYNRPEEYSSNYGWFGYITNDINRDEGQNEATMGTNMYNIEQAVGCDQGYTIWNDTIYFYFITGGSAGDIELRRFPSEGYYAITINYDIDDGWANITKEDGRDALLGLCSMISSTPKELENAIYTDCFEDVFLSDTSYTTIGDCKVKYAGGSTKNCTWTYIIKPN